MTDVAKAREKTLEAAVEWALASKGPDLNEVVRTSNAMSDALDALIAAARAQERERCAVRLEARATSEQVTADRRRDGAGGGSVRREGYGLHAHAAYVLTDEAARIRALSGKP